MSLPLPLAVGLAALRRPPQHRYGEDPSQLADLHLPPGPGPHPVAVLLHGGHWRTGFGRQVTRPLAMDLARHGIAAWNLEYRRLGSGRGSGGGWPATFEDVASGLDALASVDGVDLSRVCVIGHSAGGQLALWAASRSDRLAGECGADPVVRPTSVLALAPVTHLRRAGDSARGLLGGSPDEHPDRWAQADPMALLPPPVPILVVHPEDDATIPVARSREYAAAAAAAGADVTLVTPGGEGHRDPVDPGSRSWQAARDWITAR